MRIFEHIRYNRLPLPKILCIDATKGNAETYKNQCILVDNKKNKIFDFLT